MHMCNVLLIHRGDCGCDCGAFLESRSKVVMPQCCVFMSVKMHVAHIMVFSDVRCI